MIRTRLLPVASLVFLATTLASCSKKQMDVFDDWMPGKPKPEDAWKPESKIADPAKLFSQNCLGCHSLGATVGPALAMDNPLYLAVIPPDELKRVITNGVPGKQMPGFLEATGGSLTEEQIDLLVAYILERKKPIEGPLPPYSAPLGNAPAGEAAFNTFFAKYPGMTGPGSITDPDFLSLISDQYIRSIVIAGRPELGFPDYRSRVPGQAMTDAEISDVTAWIVSHRTDEFGQRISQPIPAPAIQPNGQTPAATTP